MKNSFVDKIILLRKENGLSQKKLGEYAGIPQTTISEWERGNSLPDIVQAEKLAHALNTTLIDILNGKALKNK
ncbi:helix-turn-helix domain-containing protein [Clostridioides difficile]|nr:helix-turn-helix transcriptional regulator [Clostridioides difficile]EIS9626875.1 helix-turn-helix transcriptional regulator [Clostridioides difficile]EKS7089158.1 helix-turn-helix transcriptional regulator [Clostridioides difficile]MBF9874507.1 helix-turn-helix transcriptional regulator [Clostridioides difficile]MBG0206354.1 helix-turn-helix transcriptional regulator [Clostridioides difficile]